MALCGWLDPRPHANLDQRATDDSTDFGASIIQADGERLGA
jgi:hypothetical protein